MASQVKARQSSDIDTGVTATAAEEQPAVRSTLLSLSLDELREWLWEPMSVDDKRMLRVLSRQMRAEGNECVRKLTVDVDKSWQPSTSLAIFPLLEELTLRSTAATVSWQQVADCFSSGISRMASTRVSKPPSLPCFMPRSSYWRCHLAAWTARCFLRWADALR